MCRFSSLGLTLALALAACGDDNPPPPLPDGGLRDAGRRDAGEPMDTGPPTDGEVPEDAGPFPDGGDAGLPVPTDGGGGVFDCVMEGAEATPLTFPTDPSGDIQTLSVAADVRGFLVTYAQFRTIGENIFVTRVPLTGDPAEMDIRITEATFNASSPAVASNGTGALVTWFDNSTDNFEIWARPLSSTDMPMGGPVRLSDTADRSDNPSLLAAGSGYLAAWVEDTGSGRNGFTRMLAGNGAPMGPPRQYTTGDESPTTVALAVRDGGFAAAWARNSDVYVAPLDATGAPDGAVMIVSTENNAQGQVDLALDESGGAVVFDVAVAGSRDEVRFRPLGPDGAPVGPERILTPSPERARDPSITKFSGGYVVSWRTTEDTDLLGPIVRLSGVDSIGNVVFGPFDTGSTQEGGGRTTVRVGPDGTLLVVWPTITDGLDTFLEGMRVRCGM